MGIRKGGKGQEKEGRKCRQEVNVRESRKNYYIERKTNEKEAIYKKTEKRKDEKEILKDKEDGEQERRTTRKGTGKRGEKKGRKEVNVRESIEWRT